MIGSVGSPPIPTGQGQNSYQQAQATQGAAQAEQRDPRENEVQRRNDPAAQSQESSAQTLKSPRNETSSEGTRQLADASPQQGSNDNPPTGESRGELLDVLV